MLREPTSKLPQVSKEDPKHGRWVLPLVVVGLIAFTVVFVRALPAADVAQSTTTTSSTTTTTTPSSTTTTTLPADVRAFLNEVDRFRTTTQDLRDQLNALNSQWEADEVGFDAAVVGFQEIADAHQATANEVTATVVPQPFADSWPDAIALSLDLVAKTDAVIEGLRAPDDGTLRREAVTAYGAAVDNFLAQLSVVEAAAPTG